MTTKLPTEDRPIQLSTELSEQVDAMLAPYKGDELELAQLAVLEVYKSGVEGSFHTIVERYREAIEGAVA